MTLALSGNGDLSLNSLQIGGSYITPYAFRNRIINGSMVIDQRNSGAAVTLNGANQFTVDRWRTGQLSGTWGSGVFSAQQVVDAPPGFYYSLKITTTTADTSGTAGDAYIIVQAIENNLILDLGFGTANAIPTTLSFWLKASIAGTYTGTVQSVGATQAYTYPFEVNITNANTWQYFSIPISAFSTINAATAVNAGGLGLVFDLGSGSNFYSSSFNTWQPNMYSTNSSAVKLVANANASLQITGVQLEAGPVSTPFENIPINMLLDQCMRYYYRITTSNSNSTYQRLGTGIAVSSTIFYITFNFRVLMRDLPTIGYSALSDFGWYNGLYNNAASSAVTSPTAISLDDETNQSATYQFTSTGLTAGQAVELSATNNKTAYIDFTAEI